MKPSFFTVQVNLINFELLAKNIPVVLPSSQSKFEAKRVQKGSLVIVGHANKQTDRQIKMISLWIKKEDNGLKISKCAQI